jgi:hypothetical protein
MDNAYAMTLNVGFFCCSWNGSQIRLAQLEQHRVYTYSTRLVLLLPHSRRGVARQGSVQCRRGALVRGRVPGPAHWMAAAASLFGRSEKCTSGNQTALNVCATTKSRHGL